MLTTGSHRRPVCHAHSEERNGYKTVRNAGSPQSIAGCVGAPAGGQQDEDSNPPLGSKGRVSLLWLFLAASPESEGNVDCERTPKLSRQACVGGGSCLQKIPPAPERDSRIAQGVCGSVVYSESTAKRQVISLNFHKVATNN